MTSKFAAVSVLLLVVSMPAQAAVEIFVSPRGDDAAPGTRTRPLRTLRAARDAVRKQRGEQAGGATIWLMAGRYTPSGTLQLDANDSGTPDEPLVIRATARGNVVLDGGVVARQYDGGELRRGDKMDYVWRAEQVVGRKGWNRPPWSTKYPLFAKVMDADPYLPLECRFAHNVFCENEHRFQYRVGYGEDGVVDIRKASAIQVEDNVDLPLSAFEDPASLDFRIRSDYPIPVGVQRIPFEKIGLYLDEYRSSMPKKADYRREIRAKFEGTPSYDPDAVYDPDTINEVLYR